MTDALDERIDRRRLLYGFGAATLLLTVVNGRCFAQAGLAIGPEGPWNRAAIEGHSDVRLRILAYAILAPNARHIQPWVAELVGDDGLLVRCDLERRLPVSDPSDRQI